MARRLGLALVPWVVVACGDDVSEAVTTTLTDSDGSTFGEVTDTVDVSGDPTSATFTTDPSTATTFDTSVTDSDSISDSVSITITDSDTDPSMTTFVDESSTDPTDPTDTTVTTSTTDTTIDPTETTETTVDPTDPTVDPTSTTDPGTTTDPTDSTSSTGDPTDATSETTGDPTGGGGFPDAPVFGTNVLDLDLVGTWGLNWDPVTGFDSVLEVDDMGNFTWTETSADCSESSIASGYLWVQGSQIVMHAEVWDRQLPWDTGPVLGETFEAPFRLRMSFSLQGSGADDYLALAAPSRITEAAPYTGESYVRLSTSGAFLGGTWRGEAQLEAIPDGQVDPVVIVRDVYQAVLASEAGVDPEGTGVRAINTTYFPVPSASDVYDGANWTCLGGCPQPSGETLVDGGNLYTYGPYGGNTHLLTFATGRTFRAGFDSDCP